MALPTTLVDALFALPADPSRGFTFIGRDRSEHVYSWEALRAEAIRRAAFLQRAGLQKGQKVALVLGEPEAFVLTFLGCSVAGLIPVPIFPRASFKNADSYVDVLSHIIETSEAQIAFALSGNHEIVEMVKSRGVQTRVEDAEVFFAGEAPSFSAVNVEPSDLCFLQFTSGSTNKPKGVCVTHASLVANTTSFIGPAGLQRNDKDVAVSWLPLFHDMGLIGFVLGTIVMDIPAVLLPTETFARSPGLWLETVTKYRGTITYAPNFAYGLVTKRVKDRDLTQLDLRSLRIAGCGAEPIRAATLVDFAKRFEPAGFDARALLPSYGMAEATLAATFHQVGTSMIVDRVSPDAMKRGEATPTAGADALEIVSCGVTFPGHEVVVVDDKGDVLPERRVGEVLVKGPSVTAGYYKNDEATAESFRNGYLYTGDLGYYADGNLYICGRIKDLIIIRGANHYPQDIEWAVGDIDGVRRGNVVAFSVSADGTEELVVVAEGNQIDAARLEEEIRRVVLQDFGLSAKEVVIAPVGALPKTSSGKAQRRKSKALYESGELGGWC